MQVELFIKAFFKIFLHHVPKRINFRLNFTKIANVWKQFYLFFRIFGRFKIKLRFHRSHKHFNGSNVSDTFSNSINHFDFLLNSDSDIDCLTLASVTAYTSTSDYSLFWKNVFINVGIRSATGSPWKYLKRCLGYLNWQSQTF